MLLKALAQAIEPGCFGHLGKGFGRLLLRVKDIPQFVEEQLVDASGAVGGELSTLTKGSAWGSTVVSAGEDMNFQSPPSFHGPLVSGADRIVEELVYQAGRGRNLSN